MNAEKLKSKQKLNFQIMKKAKITVQKMKGKLWYYSLISIIIGLGELICLTCCKKDEDKPAVEYGTVVDIDGNSYKTVKIGSQEWMAENLKTTKYRNGDSIKTTIPSTLDLTNETSPKYQWAYGGIESNVATYGRLYTWYAVTDSRNVCPIGWHIPTDAEWTTLTNYLGGINVAGGKMKEIGTTHWETPNSGATNESGFTALPGGFRDWKGTFYYLGHSGLWWDSVDAYWDIDFDYSYIDYWGDLWNNGYSVRCIKGY